MLPASLRATLAREARQLLAADLRVRGQKPVPPAVDALLAEDPSWRAVRSTRITEMVTVAAAPRDSRGAGRSQLVELKAVDGEFPFYGTLSLEPARPLSELLAAGRGARALEDAVQELLVAILDVDEAAHRRRLVGGDLGAREPAAAGVLVEVVARVDRAIHRGGVEAERGERRGRARRRRRA